MVVSFRVKTTAENKTTSALQSVCYEIMIDLNVTSRLLLNVNRHLVLLSFNINTLLLRVCFAEQKEKHVCVHRHRGRFSDV